MPLYVNTVEDARSYLGRMRRKGGLSRAALSRLAGLRGPSTICNIENGRNDPALTTLIALIDAMGYRLAITPKEVLTHEPTP